MKELELPLTGNLSILPRNSGETVIVSWYPLDTGEESGLALFRANGDRAFTPREFALARIVLEEIPWLHWRERPSRPPAAKLSPRQKQTLGLLHTGHSRMEIACQLGISDGTATGYIRELYRIFGVSSQAELMRTRLHLLPESKERGKGRSGEKKSSIGHR